MKRITLIALLFILLLSDAGFAQKAQNQLLPLPKIGIDVGASDSGQDVSVTLQILLLMTVLSLAPSLMIMTTSYLRLIIVFHFLKTAMGTPQMPPSQLLAGMALFVTFFIMAPTFNKINEEALQPLMKNEITTKEAYDKGIEPLRQFMFKNTRDADMELFIGLANMSRPSNKNDIPTYILIPAYVISECRAGFIIGFFLFIPFIMVDMIVSSILLSMGMMMLPPTMISLPFKILLFILVDGWNLIIGSVVRSFAQ
jgi:flagellar biosynthesis protein FliP